MWASCLWTMQLKSTKTLPERRQKVSSMRSVWYWAWQFSVSIENWQRVATFIGWGRKNIKKQRVVRAANGITEWWKWIKSVRSKRRDWSRKSENSRKIRLRQTNRDALKVNRNKAARVWAESKAKPDEQYWSNGKNNATHIKYSE